MAPRPGQRRAAWPAGWRCAGLRRAADLGVGCSGLPQAFSASSRKPCWPPAPARPAWPAGWPAVRPRRSADAARGRRPRPRSAVTSGAGQGCSSPSREALRSGKRSGEEQPGGPLMPDAVGPGPGRTGRHRGDRLRRQQTRWRTRAGASRPAGRGLVRFIDLAFVTKDERGATEIAELADDEVATRTGGSPTRSLTWSRKPIWKVWPARCRRSPRRWSWSGRTRGRLALPRPSARRTGGSWRSSGYPSRSCGARWRRRGIGALYFRPAYRESGRNVTAPLTVAKLRFRC